MTARRRSNNSVKNMQQTKATSKKSTGSHYTPTMLAEFVADAIVECVQRDSSVAHILDPAVGDGELLSALLHKWSGFANAFGFDTDADAIKSAEKRLSREFPDVSLQLITADFLAINFVGSNGDLFYSRPPQVDVVIANPPYVRTQVLGAMRAQSLTRQFGLAGRVDLYFAFIEGIAEVLKPGGVAGIIVSNRFMTTRSGCTVRERLLDRFDVLHVWDFGDTKLFEAAVLPAVLLLRKKNKDSNLTSKFSSIYSTKLAVQFQSATIIDALGQSGVVAVDGNRYLVRHGELDHGNRVDGVWKLKTKESDEWLARVHAHTFCTFGDLGKIRVGVKTTADKVFIRDDWESLCGDDQPELLRPLITHTEARRYRARFVSRPKRILYTHELRDGEKHTVNLDQFPRAARYLERHRAALESRRYVIEGGRQWFEIWVPQNPARWPLPKLVFPDISEKPTFWIDLNGSIVNGDCYWLTVNDPSQTELLWLALAVANSSFAEEFYDHEFHNKLYAGRRRFMTQYVEKFPLPDPTTHVAKQIIASAKTCFNLDDSVDSIPLQNNIDQLVCKAFGSPIEEVARKRDLQLAV
jgi:adenine-specific DNA-methyltransferase